MPNLSRPERKHKPNFPGKNSPDLNNSRWRKLRESILLRIIFCECCEFSGIYTDITGSGKAHLDHIIARSDGGSVYDIRNIAVLCRRCHAKKSALEAIGLKPYSIRTESGLIPDYYEKQRVFQKICSPEKKSKGSAEPEINPQLKNQNND
jgi:hypothetical protein